MSYPTRAASQQWSLAAVRTAMALAAVVVLGGCDKDHNRMLIYLEQPGEGAPQKRPTIQFEVQGDGDPTFFTLSHDSFRWGPARTDYRGETRVSFTIMHGTEPTSTTGTITLPPRSKWVWSLFFEVADKQPQLCPEGSNCRIWSFDLDPVLNIAPEYQLWVWKIGNRWSKPEF